MKKNEKKMKKNEKKNEKKRKNLGKAVCSLLFTFEVHRICCAAVSHTTSCRGKESHDDTPSLLLLNTLNKLLTSKTLHLRDIHIG
jgi:hypothetical protein